MVLAGQVVAGCGSRRSNLWAKPLVSRKRRSLWHSAFSAGITQLHCCILRRHSVCSLRRIAITASGSWLPIGSGRHLGDSLTRQGRSELASLLEFQPDSAYRVVARRVEAGIRPPPFVRGDSLSLSPRSHGRYTGEPCLPVAGGTANKACVCFQGSCSWRFCAFSTTAAAGQARGTAIQSCSATCMVKSFEKEERDASDGLLENVDLGPLSELLVQYFKVRGISEKTLQRAGVLQSDDALAFVYKQGDGKIVNCKFRDSLKRFWEAQGGDCVFYGLDLLDRDAKQVVIVEGEIDKLSMDEAGIPNCLSVPNGAPLEVTMQSSSLPVSKENDRYAYIWSCEKYFRKATRIILATDGDGPGHALAAELARRFGRERCWRVKWPRLAGTEKCIDANDVLRRLGKDVLREVVKQAEVYPLHGLYQYSQFAKEIDDYYHLRLGDERGVSTGWHSLDDIYRVVPGELTVVTGVPNSGKSEWIDALLCNLNRQRQWCFALCSMENKVREHARKLLEKHLSMPFFDAPYANSVPRMTPEDLAKGQEWLNASFYPIRCEDEELPSVDWVLNLARAAVMRHGIRGLVIDPYNELDHQRPSHQTETEYVSQLLTKIKRFAQHHDCHVWFVAHPKQLAAWRGKAPGLYDIAGSAHFINKCDNGVVIHRNRDPDAGPLDRVQVLVKKVRNKAAGTIGEAYLTYDRTTGRYNDRS